MENPKGHFTVKKITNFADLKEGQQITLPESDLCFQDGNKIFQFEYVEPEVKEKVQVEPGVFAFVETNAGLRLNQMELKKRDLLMDLVNTEKIVNEAKKFFSRLHIYDKHKRPKRRGVLLYSPPGMGKSAAIEQVSQDLIKEDPGTVIINWSTSEIEPDSVHRFFSQVSEYDEKVTRVVLIMEDIGGGSRPGSHGPSAIPSGLLNLLDGIGDVFKKPTFIVSTTNHPENLLAELGNRPGRFHIKIKLEAPNEKDRIRLLEFISHREITDDEKKAITCKGTEEFSIAHIEEVVIRADLDDKTYQQVVDELIAETKEFKGGFEGKNKSSMGFDSHDDDY